MIKSNFEKLPFAEPPSEEGVRSAVAGYGTERAEDGRSARRTGRIVQLATVVKPEFKQWLAVVCAKTGKTQAAVLEDMQAAYIRVHGE